MMETQLVKISTIRPVFCKFIIYDYSMYHVNKYNLKKKNRTSNKIPRRRFIKLQLFNGDKNPQ